METRPCQTAEKVILGIRPTALSALLASAPLWWLTSTMRGSMRSMRPAVQPPEKVVAPDPSGVNHNIFHHHGNPSGGFDIDRPETNEYLKTLSHALAPAQRILLLGHGGGKANFSHLLESYLEKHHRDVASRIVANVRADIDDLTDAEVVRIAEAYFGINGPKRDYPRTR